MMNMSIIGNLTKDPETRTLASGAKCCSFSVAVNRRTASGEQTAIYVNVGAWDKRGEVCQKYLKKGAKVYVSGSNVSAHAWIDRNGNPKAEIDLTANEVEFLSRADAAPAQQSAPAQEEYTEVEDDELPF